MGDQSTRRRVKLYALNAERQWDDRGTGHVTSSYVEKLQGVSLLVKAESDGSVLLESKIQQETIYQKQQETLIVWSEGDNFDLALSFQERAGCDEIWEKICQVQGRDPSVEITQEMVEESEDERFDDMSDTVPSIELPAAEVARLEEISELVNSCLHSAIKREKLTLAVEADNYIPKLMRMFQMCEDLENTAGLHHLHDIIINLFQLNKNALIESMFKIDVIFDVVGCLEYDPANPVPTRHREYLRQMANFKQVLPIRNSELLAKIHQTYRVQYIQDIVLPTPPMFEDNVLSTLSSFIYFNKLDIVRQLQDDEKFLTEFFSLLSDEKTPITKRRDLVLFLKEFCTFSHTLQPQSKETFFKTLLSLGVLQALETTLTVDAGDLSQPGQVIKAACIDILMYIVETVPSMVREHMLQQAETCDDDQLLMNLIVEQMVCDRDPEVGSAVQLSGIVRTLIDPDNMMSPLNRSEKTEFFAFFYKHCMHSLVAPLLSNTTDDQPLHDDPATVQLLNLVLELLSFCVEHHTFHAKNFIINRNMVARILVLMKSKHKYLVLDALRFLRKMVALKDDGYTRHIVKQNLFAPVVEAFFHNQGRYNLLDSAVIELFEFIKTEDIKALLSYIVETFGDKLLDVTYVQTFRSLKQRYEQQQDRLQQRTAALESVPSILRGTSRYRRDARQMDEDEEMWFNDDDEFEDSVEGGGAHHPPGLGGAEGCRAVPGLHAASAVSELEHIGKMIEGRSKLFSSGAELPDKPSAESTCQGVNGPAARLGLIDSAPVTPDYDVTTAPSPATPATATATAPDGVSLVKKVGLVDYDADSDEEDEEAEPSPAPSPARPPPAVVAALEKGGGEGLPARETPAGSGSGAAQESAPDGTGEAQSAEDSVAKQGDGAGADQAVGSETQPAPDAQQPAPTPTEQEAPPGDEDGAASRDQAATVRPDAESPARTESATEQPGAGQPCAAKESEQPSERETPPEKRETGPAGSECGSVASPDEQTPCANAEDRPQTPDGQKSPPDGQKSPTDSQKSPKDDQKSQPDSQQSPSDGQKSPPEGQKSPLASQKSPPPDSQKSPPDSQKSPLDSQKSPPDSLKSPLDSQKSPPASLQSPLDSQKSPPGGQKSPPEAAEHRDADQLPSAKRPRLDVS